MLRYVQMIQSAMTMQEQTLHDMQRSIDSYGKSVGELFALVETLPSESAGKPPPRNSEFVHAIGSSMSAQSSRGGADSSAEKTTHFGRDFSPDIEAVESNDRPAADDACMSVPYSTTH